MSGSSPRGSRAQVRAGAGGAVARGRAAVLLGLVFALCAARGASAGGLSPLELSKLRRAKIACSHGEEWLTPASGGARTTERSLACVVPAELRAIVEAWPPGALAAALADPDVRYAGYAALAALGRHHLLPSTERIRFALELARREHEPFASARVGFVFADERRGGGRTDPTGLTGARLIEALAVLAAPFSREMTHVLSEYLFPPGAPRPSTLACYLAKTMGDLLGDAISPALERVVAWDRRSFEAGLASEALANLAQAARFAKGPFDFQTRIGKVVRQKDGCVLLWLSGKVPRPGTTVEIVEPRLPQRVSRASVVEAPSCLPGRPAAAAPYTASVAVLALASSPPSGQDRSLEPAIGVVAPPAPLQLLGGSARADLDRDGRPERFAVCTSSEGLHLTVLTGSPPRVRRLWHAYHYLGYDVEPSCSPVESAP
jgi:hypothetical protein